VDEDIIEKSPARGLTIPNFTRDRDETILSLEAVRQFEDVLEGKDKILWQLLSRCGLRAGEVFGLQWQDLTADHSLRVQRIYARGKVSEPKTKKSKAPVVVPVVLYKELNCGSAPRTVLTARGYSRRVETAEVLSCRSTTTTGSTEP
jgi:integrase